MRIIAVAGAWRWWPWAALLLGLTVGAGCAPKKTGIELPEFPPYLFGEEFLEEQKRIRKETLAKQAHREEEMKRNRRKRFERHYLEWEPIYRRILLAEAARERKTEN